jgi:hypothetical protein
VELTPEQKRISPSIEFWESRERKKKQVERWKKQPISPEEWEEELKSRKAFQESCKKNHDL